MNRKAATFAAMLALSACTTASYEALDIGKTPGATSGLTDGASYSASAPRFGDRDPHDWTGKTPWQYSVHGVDVAKYQGVVDWPTVRAAGVSFAFLKATEGGDRVDDMFARNWRAARAAGLPRGAYHFFYFCRPAFEQARWFTKHVPNDPSALPPVLDMEWNHKSPSCKLRPEPDAVRKEMEVFISIVGRHYGKTPVIYTTVDFYRDNQLWRIKGYPFWLRSTAGHPAEKYGDQGWTFWQYTGTGSVPGVKGDADINVFRGSATEWKQWLAKATN